MKRTIAAALLLLLAPSGVAAQGLAMQRISGKAFAALAARAVDALPTNALDAYVPAFSVPDQFVQPGRVALRVQRPLVTGTYVNVPIDVDVDGKLTRTVYAGYRIQHDVLTAVAAHDLAPGTVIAAQDVRLARVPFSGEPGNGTAVLIGRKITGAVVKGQPIYIAQTQADQIVQAGSTVVLVVRDGAVSLTADVIARTSGALGDEVSVFNPSTNKALSGIVTAPGMVELDLSGADTQ